MSNKILIKKTSTPGKIPLSTDLDIGELALNMNDSILFFKDASNNIKQISGSSGSDPLKQDVLVSGTNIKTVNNLSILGPGNLDIAGGAGAAQNVFIQETEPDIGVGTKALWIQTTGNKISFWLKEN